VVFFLIDLRRWGKQSNEPVGSDNTNVFSGSGNTNVFSGGDTNIVSIVSGLNGTSLMSSIGDKYRRFVDSVVPLFGCRNRRKVLSV
jgi:hypothetical protein